MQLDTPMHFFTALPCITLFHAYMGSIDSRFNYSDVTGLSTNH